MEPIKNARFFKRTVAAFARMFSDIEHEGDKYIFSRTDGMENTFTISPGTIVLGKIIKRDKTVDQIGHITIVNEVAYDIEEYRLMVNLLIERAGLLEI